MEVFKDILQKLPDSDKVAAEVHFQQLDSSLFGLASTILIKSVLANDKITDKEKLIAYIVNQFSN